MEIECWSVVFPLVFFLFCLPCAHHKLYLSPYRFVFYNLPLAISYSILFFPRLSRAWGRWWDGPPAYVWEWPVFDRRVDLNRTDFKYFIPALLLKWHHEEKDILAVFMQFMLLLLSKFKCIIAYELHSKQINILTSPCSFVLKVNMPVSKTCLGCNGKESYLLAGE